MVQFDFYISLTDFENVKCVTIDESATFVADIFVDGELRKNVQFCYLNETQIRNSRGKAHLCIGEGNLTIKKVGNTLTYGVCTGNKARIATFEARGLELKLIKVLSGFTVISQSGKKWTDVNLYESWSEYDDQSEEVVFINSIKSEIE